MYKQIIALVKRLGIESLSKWGKVADIGQKKQWLTEEDLRIEKALVDHIRNLEGEHKVYAEELNDEYVQGDNVWIIDPVSCTFNFIHGLFHYSLCLSHMQNGKLKFCVIYDPTADEMFTAYKSKGAFLNGKKIEVTKSRSDIGFIFDPHPLYRYKKETNLELLDKLMNLGRNVVIGSFALHYAYVACGRVHFAISANKDTYTEFAGKLLVEEAGGKFTDFQGRDLQVEPRGVVCSNGVLHNRLVEITKEYSLCG